ncbi:MAG: WecB/TagA/CpsF family glycosyltransferase [Deltaproteobacteria bacterium]|nr:WecB/TagA/CpsF family glycosyltransferase [Deltaproteobacteria bacterium]
MRSNVLGCHIDIMDMSEVLDRVEAFIIEGGSHQHVVVNVDKLVKAHRDPNLKNIINQCDLVNADGMPVVWASRLLGDGLKERIAGIDLFIKLVERAEGKGWRVYFLGAKDAVVSKIVSLLKEKHPSLNIAGYRNGYWTKEEESNVVKTIKSAKPDILFVAMSSPQKEEFLGAYLKDMQVPFAMGVGGSFDVVAGIVKRAPVWMQRTGLEWFYRFLQEPRRMFKRYFIDDTYFIVLLVKELIGRWAAHLK